MIVIGSDRQILLIYDDGSYDPPDLKTLVLELTYPLYATRLTQLSLDQ